MPIYVCYRGYDRDYLAYLRPPAPFVVQDALGRDWVCFETPVEKEPDKLMSLEDLIKLVEAQALDYMLGLIAEATDENKLFDCPDEASLRRQLVLDTYPKAEESARRLAQAGWTEKSWAATAAGPPRVSLIIEKAEESLPVVGETKNEVWYLAAQKVLG